MNDILHRIVQDRAALSYPIGLALALMVTVHVLLRKRELASAAGWIGFAFFAPITGTIIYFLFGVNRVRRRARRLRPDGHEPDTQMAAQSADPLERGISRLTGQPVLGGNLVEMYQDGDEAYPAMLAAIASARRSIGMSSYIFRADRWGSRFIAALADASARGVQVRVLIDGIGGGWLLSPAYRSLRRKNVPAARFLHSPLPWRMPFLNLRSHKKILVVDGCVGFTGGMNVGDENVIAENPRSPVRDIHFRFAGPVTAQLTDAFAREWSFACNEDLQGPGWFPDLQPAGTAPARVITSGPDEDIEKLEFAMLQAVACAGDSIVIMTPYFLPDDRLVAALSLAAMRGVSVDVVVPERSNHRLVDWALRANVGPLISDGVRMWRSPPPFRHAKVLVVDGRWSLVGSCNWDNRSFRLNFELCVEAYDQHLAAALHRFVADCQGSALTGAELTGRPLPARLRDAAARLCLPYL